MLTLRKVLSGLPLGLPELSRAPPLAIDLDITGI
jgi:hypothetical protein